MKIIFLTICLLPVLTLANTSCPLGVYYIPPTQYDDTSTKRAFVAMGRHGIREVYIKANRLEKAKQLVSIARATLTGARLYAWFGLKACLNKKDKSCFRHNNPKTIMRFEQKVQRILSAGFDGLHLNLEPVSNGDKAFLDLLKKFGRISIAGYSLKPTKDYLVKPRSNLKPYYWSRAYYQKVLSHINQLVVMNYDTAISTVDKYMEFTSDQTKAFHNLVSTNQVELRMALPVYDIGRRGLFDKKIENLNFALQGTQKYLSRNCQKKFGLTFFRFGEISAQEWNTIDSLSPTR